jgi:heme-degrading monooxygenase HmoA
MNTTSPSSKSFLFATFRLLGVSLGSLLLQCCTFSPGFKGPAYSKENRALALPSHEKVIVAITHAKLIRKERKDFDKHSRKIYTTLYENPGYLGGRVKVILGGDEVWTLTVWKDSSSLQQFVNSRRHLDAMYKTDQAVSHMRSISQEMLVENVPYTWKAVDIILEDVPLTKYQSI